MRRYTIRATQAESDAYLWEGAEGALGFDVGAHDGYSVGEMVTRCTRVAAFEPAAESFALMKDRWAGDPRAELFNIAVCDHVGVLSLGVRAAPMQSGQLTAAEMPDQGANGEHHWGAVTGYREMPCSTLDALSEQIGVPDFVKIDTEGHEAQILKGATSLLAARRPRLLVEFHAGALRDECTAILEAAGYDLEFVAQPHFADGTYMRENYGWIKAVA